MCGMRDCFHGTGNMQFFHGASHMEVIPSLSSFTFPCSTGQCSRCLDTPELILGAAQGPEEGWDELGFEELLCSHSEGWKGQVAFQEKGREEGGYSLRKKYSCWWL